MAVGSLTALGTGVGAALTINTSGVTEFHDTLNANSGVSATHTNGTVNFDKNVTLGNGDTGSNFNGNVNLKGISFSGYDGISFGDAASDQTMLTAGPDSITSHNSAITFNNKLDGNQILPLTRHSRDEFNAKVGSVAQLGTGTGLALAMNSTGLSTFNDTLQTRSGITAVGPQHSIKL